jgi:hypothetical protein
MKFKKGDRVLYKHDKDKVPATVIEVDTSANRVDIQYDDDPRWPNGDWYDENELEFLT